MDKRTDRLTAVHVDLAVNVKTVYGLSAGVRVLQEYGVTPSIVQRVLINGDPRRGANKHECSQEMIKSQDGSSH